MIELANGSPSRTYRHAHVLSFRGCAVRIPNNATSNKKGIMYLSEYDLIAITIALVSMFALVLSSASANKRLTEQNHALRTKLSALRSQVRNESPVRIPNK